LGLLRAFKNAGVRIASAKSGPDYIDPAFHAAATGMPCATLDAWAMPQAALVAHAHAACRRAKAELLIVEGAMGLIDGAGRHGRGSTADVAAALDAPVVLVIDAARKAQSAVLPALGLRAARPDLALAGVIFNAVASDRHAEMLTASAARFDIPVLGCVLRNAALAVPSRHLGLVQASEHPELEAFLNTAADTIAGTVPLDAVRNAAQPLRAVDVGAARGSAPVDIVTPPLGQVIAVACDAAFAFSYPHMLNGWRAAGARIVTFAPLADEAPAPDADAVFLPGGYPELHAAQLAHSAHFKRGMHAAAVRGATVYGECGGYMVLGEALIDADGHQHAMLGMLPLTTSFAKRRRHLGYRVLSPRPGAPFTGPLAAHEFHYATIVDEGSADRLFDAVDANGTACPPMGLRRDRVSGSFAHVIGPASHLTPPAA
ncbi:MAG: cobyrinate a,c-diamide synthase, partial [Pseudomonadota bacterium]